MTEEKTDDDDGRRGKDVEHEICVITWNVNKSSEQYDFPSDVAQCWSEIGNQMSRRKNWDGPC